MPSSKEIWGPYVWGLLHSMADVSNRTDIVFLWMEVIKTTMRSLPCAACRKHMSEYWSSHTFIPPKWNKLSSDAIRIHIRSALHQFHNHVNKSLGKPIVTLSEAPPEPKRNEIISSAIQYYQQIQREWKTVPIEWKQAIHVLLRVLATGPL